MVLERLGLAIGSQGFPRVPLLDDKQRGNARQNLAGPEALQGRAVLHGAVLTGRLRGIGRARNTCVRS